MKLKDVLGKVIENKKNKQLNVNIKKNNLRKIGISHSELLDMKIEPRLKRLVFDN